MELDRFDWLAGTVEPAIDPDRRIVDPHHHLWDRGGSTYLAPELLADLTGSHNVTKTVFVECRAKYDREAEPHFAPVGETTFVAGEAAITDAAGGPTIAGIVSHADMMLGDRVEEVLAAHDAAGKGRFRGVRHATSWDASDEIRPGHSSPTRAMMDTPEFRAGVAKLAEMGFSFDSWLFFTQLGELERLARALPQASIVLNHLGGPIAIGPYRAERDQAHAAWRAAMTSIAGCDNVVLKVGGIGMDNYFGLGWAAAPAPPSSEQVAGHWSDDVRWCIDLFGPTRCMLESNFPVDRQALPYPVLWNALQIMASTYSETEQDELFAGTAERVYRLT